MPIEQSFLRLSIFKPLIIDLDRQTPQGRTPIWLTPKHVIRRLALNHTAEPVEKVTFVKTQHLSYGPGLYLAERPEKSLRHVAVI